MITKLKRFFIGLWKVSNDSITQYQRDKVAHMGAALAYYTIFSLPAIIIIMIGLIGFFYGQDAVEGRIYTELHTVIGSETAEQIQKAVTYIGTPRESWWATIIGLGFLVFVSTGIFFVIQEALNTVFNVKAPTPPKMSILWVIINRLISFGMILLVCALFVTAIILNTVVAQVAYFVEGNELFVASYLPDFLANWVPFVSSYFLMFIRIAASIFILSLFFFLVYKILPAVNIGWRYATAGALFAGVFFWLGQELMGIYLGHISAVSAYGAAGSLIILLLWVYYSSQLLFIGAEFIKALCRYREVVILPKNFAERLNRQKAATPTTTVINQATIITEDKIAGSTNELDEPQREERL
jgi:membrane protein